MTPEEHSNAIETKWREDEARDAFVTARARIMAEIEDLLARHRGPNVNHARQPLAKALTVLRDPHATVIASPGVREVRPQFTD